jgi:PKD repeat protein
MEQLNHKRITPNLTDIARMSDSYLKTLQRPKHLLFWTIFFLSAGINAQAPVAGFTVPNNEGCAPYSVNFTNTSTGAASYHWNFGNGNFSRDEIN